MLICWRGSTPSWQTLFLFPGGFGIGLAHASLYIGLAASVEKADMAIAGTGYYLCGNIGAVAGLSAHNALFQATLQHSLEAKLDGLVDGDEVGSQIRRLSEADRLRLPNERWNLWTTSRVSRGR